MALKLNWDFLTQKERLNQHQNIQMPLRVKSTLQCKDHFSKNEVRIIFIGFPEHNSNIEAFTLTHCM